jgi:ABC-2 type transport system ATP-binding protein
MILLNFLLIIKKNKKKIMKRKKKMSESESYLIQTNGLKKIFGEDTIAVNNLDLKVPKNSIYGFLGPNGAGKTTTMKLLLGLIRPTSGSATVFGHDIVNESIDIRRRIGYLPQDVQFYEYMTVKETLNFTIRFYFSGPKKAINDRISVMLQMTGLTKLENRKVKGLSGGERQRLGIAQAYIHEPELLILDEPAASLDPMGRQSVLEAMKGMRQNTTIFYSTHILDDVQKVSDNVAILNRGSLVTQGPIEEILKSKQNPVFEITLNGADLEKTRFILKEQPWVSAINVNQNVDGSAWEITVTDVSAAEENLLGLVQKPGIKVTNFGQKEVNLEDIFIDLVKGGK